jgi:hypothetical protein
MNKSTHSPHGGQTLVEFALILPIFLFLLIVIFDFGRAIYYYNAIHNAAREGARYGVIHPNVADYPNIVARSEQYAIGLGLSDITVWVGPGASEYVGNFNNPTIMVTVTYTFRPVTPFVAQFICGCNTLTLTSDAVMRTEAIPEN